MGVHLTKREVEVLDALVECHTGPAIEAKLGLANGTLSTHFGTLFTKTGIHSRVGLAVWWVKARPKHMQAAKLRARADSLEA